jgi:hypothetical protein
MSQQRQGQSRKGYLTKDPLWNTDGTGGRAFPGSASDIGGKLATGARRSDSRHARRGLGHAVSANAAVWRKRQRPGDVYRGTAIAALSGIGGMFDSSLARHARGPGHGTAQRVEMAAQRIQEPEFRIQKDGVRRCAGFLILDSGFCRSAVPSIIQARRKWHRARCTLTGCIGS